MLKKFITTNSAQTQALGKLLAEDIQGGGVVCLSGELGAGKTTFTQGFLAGLGLEGPFTSPTFLVMKKYDLKNNSQNLKANSYKLKAIYHIDAYRVSTEDILALGWEEMVANKNNIIIIEWAERVREIIPKDALWINFKWMGEEERRISFGNSPNF